MSGGYFYGGRAADNDSNRKQLSAFILLAAGGMCLMNIGKNQLLMFLTSLGLNSLLTSTVSAFVLFTFPAFMLAAVFPYVLRMALTSVENSGKNSGSLIRHFDIWKHSWNLPKCDTINSSFWNNKYHLDACHCFDSDESLQ